jgi:hypothetical protein
MNKEKSQKGLIFRGESSSTLILWSIVEIRHSLPVLYRALPSMAPSVPWLLWWYYHRRVGYLTCSLVDTPTSNEVNYEIRNVV